MQSVSDLQLQISVLLWLVKKRDEVVLLVDKLKATVIDETFMILLLLLPSFLLLMEGVWLSG